MNRPIKYRAWNGNEMLYQIYDNIGTDLETWLDSEYEVMEYTGVRDIEGVYIFEGDILKSGEVVWDDWGEGPAWCLKDTYLSRQGVRNLHTFFAFTTPFKVIGNIYQNLELIEGLNEE